MPAPPPPAPAPAPPGVPRLGPGAPLIVREPDGATHVSVVGDGVLCGLLARTPWSRTVGTWISWDGTSPSCRDCARHLLDLIDSAPVSDR